MSASYGSNQAPKVTNIFLNKVDDPAPGTVMASVSGSITPQYPGQLGAILTLDAATALSLSDVTGTGTLYQGLYQYVKFKAASTAANVRGQIVYWEDYATFTVTPDWTAALNGKIAGITLNAVTKGQYGWIQIAGKASVKFAAAVTKATPADGDLVVADASVGITADSPEEATTVTAAILKAALGVAMEAPAAGAVKLVMLRYLGINLGQ